MNTQTREEMTMTYLTKSYQTGYDFGAEIVGKIEIPFDMEVVTVRKRYKVCQSELEKRDYVYEKAWEIAANPGFHIWDEAREDFENGLTEGIQTCVRVRFCERRKHSR